MSRDYRDQRGRPLSGKTTSCPGCPYCGHGKYKRADRRKSRRNAKARIRRDLGATDD